MSGVDDPTRTSRRALAAAAISARMPAGFHPFLGNVAAMSIGTALIVPLLSHLPGVPK